MIIEQHYDEEVLAEFLGEPGAAATRDKHLANCNLCQRTLTSLRSTAQTLTQPAVWDKTPLSTAPRPETLAFLRGMQKSMADEDTLAAVWIKQLLAGPRETWAPRLAEHPEWRTGGMVRGLIDRVENAINTVPEDGIAIAALAADVATKLTTRNARHLEGLSYYYRGYGLWYTGRLMEALDDFDHAEGLLSASASAELDCARVWLMRAMVYQMLERRDEALMLANRASTVFAAYGDTDRVAAARSAAAITLEKTQRFREAAAIHAEVAAMEHVSDRWRVSALSNVGRCYQAIGDLDRATESLVEAIHGFERLGMMTFRSKSRWVLAEIFARQGKHEQALKLYLELRQEFQELGMWNDVALTSLDASEVLVMLGRGAEIGDICRAAIGYFVANGLARTEPALRGLSYLQETAARGRPIPEAIRGVRAFLLEPERDPARLFASLKS
jgi:tetratricopeptide (TPR) repeat protein